MRRYLSLAYGLACHGLFLGVYAWMAAFVGNFDFGFLPTLDAEPRMSIAPALGINVLLVLVFSLQHSVMARPRFKQWWTRLVPTHLERSTYVLASCVAMVAILLFWQPLGGVVWNVRDGALRTLLHVLFAIGWIMVPAVTFLINHFDLFGTRQTWLHFRRRPYTPVAFGTPGPYRVVRHPLYVGWLIAFWATPTMTVTHLVFAGLLSAYIFAAIPFEERDLIEFYGDRYETYRRRVGGLIPRLRALGRPQPALKSTPQSSAESKPKPRPEHQTV